MQNVSFVEVVLTGRALNVKKLSRAACMEPSTWARESRTTDEKSSCTSGNLQTSYVSHCKIVYSSFGKKCKEIHTWSNPTTEYAIGHRQTAQKICMEGWKRHWETEKSKKKNPTHFQKKERILISSWTSALSFHMIRLERILAIKIHCTFFSPFSLF